jgi:ferric-dicitrate binding protein FerR (iron transport regulator)
MENSNQYDELLIRYLVDELNSEEKVFVEEWINSSEQNRKYFEELKDVWNLAAVKQTLDQVLDQMYVDEKWNRFKQTVTPNEAKVISLSQKEEWDSEIEEEERPGRRSVVYRLLVSAAIAASVILVIGLGWKFFVNNKQETPVALNTNKKADSIMTVVRHEVNTTGKAKTIVLQDGSQIVLWDKSEVSFQEPFINNRRDITLIGKADFKVAKDSTRPFTVYSGDLATTALGTQFIVTAFENENRITVRLYEGKVVVKPVVKGNRKLKKDIYLLPGQEFIYDNNITAKVRTFKLNDVAAREEGVMKEEQSQDDPSLPQNAKGSWYMFNNQPLEQVFDHLAEIYNVKIVYNKEDVQDMYFIGKFDKSASLEVILNRIGTLNNLTITKKDSTFTISK